MSKSKKIYIVSTVEYDNAGYTHSEPRGYFSSQKKAEAAMRICVKEDNGYGDWLPIKETELDSLDGFAPDWHIKDRFS